MNHLLHDIIQQPIATLLIICNLVLIESLLSVDNAAVLATMVMKLTPEQRSKALKYGIVGAYLFRGISLFLATYLVKIWWLKAIGGLYLLYLFIDWLITKKRANGQQEGSKENSRLYRLTVGRLGNFWGTVVSVELMDMAFSLDNVFAAVAFSRNIIIILCGVFIGILAMRFVAQGFVKLMEKYPFLESCAYVVICLLGIKLSLPLPEHFFPGSQLTNVLENPVAERFMSVITLAIFFLPLLTSILFNVPAKKVK